MERISHYEIIRRLGKGGMGEVHEATDLDLGRRVALKFIAEPYANDADALRRFDREARVAAALHHPHIATLFAFDRSTARPFLVMELLGGRTLRDVLSLGPMAVADALAVARDVSVALAYAHRHAVAHRDIKPENLMFDAEGRIKITDFGLARIAGASRLTRTGSSLGTPFYMAPELLHESEPTDEPAAEGEHSPADVFALGVSLYEMLAGELPFRGHNALSTLYTIANSAPRPLRELRPEVPAEVAALVARMLEKHPTARPTAAAVATELGALTGVTPSSTWSSGATSAPAGDELANPSAVTTSLSSARTLPVPPSPERGDDARPAVPGAAARGARGWFAFRWRVGLVAVGALAALLAWGLGVWREQAVRRAVAHNNAGHDSLASGNPAAARAEFEAALALAPHYAEPKLNLATALVRDGEVDRAAELYGDVLRENPRRDDLLAAAHYGLGELDLRARAWPSAVTHLREAARRDSTRAEYPNNLAFALVQAGRTDEALRTVREALARFPAEPALFKNGALAWFASGQFDSALAAADHSVRLRPAYVAAWLVKLRCEAARGDRVGAAASLEALRRLEPGAEVLAEAEAALATTAAPASVPAR